jgi:hypothetical protein
MKVLSDAESQAVRGVNRPGERVSLSGIRGAGDAPARRATTARFLPPCGRRAPPPVGHPHPILHLMFVPILDTALETTDNRRIRWNLGTLIR